MNKQELIEVVSKSTGLSKANVDRAIKGIIYNVSCALSKGENVTFVGFGTFERRQRKARRGVNPRNPEQKISIPAKKVAAFSAGSELKAAVATGKTPKCSIEPLKQPQAKAKAKAKTATKKVAKKKGKKGRK